MNDWVSNGYKNDYEQIAAFIDQVMQRDMALLKQEYHDELREGTAHRPGFRQRLLLFVAHPRKLREVQRVDPVRVHERGSPEPHLV